MVLAGKDQSIRWNNRILGTAKLLNKRRAPV